MTTLGALAVVLAGGLLTGIAPRDLYQAARVGDLAAVRAAVLAGADVNGVQMRIVDFREAPETALFAAAEAGHTEVVRYLLEAGADPDIRCMEDGTALTIAAARSGTVEVLRLLIDAGADVLGPRPKGLPALGWSSWNGDLESFLLLLEASRRAGIEPEDEARILEKLQHRSDELRHVIQRLLTWKPGSVPPLHVAARSGTVAELQAQLAAGEAASAADDEGWTGLHWAALFGDLLKARLLLAAGADPNAKTSGGCTPLLLAARLRVPELALLLLDAGAEPNAADEKGWTAVHVAATMSGPEMIWLLLERQADPARTLSWGPTPAKLAEYRKERLGVDVRWAFDGRSPPANATMPDQVELATNRPAPVIRILGAEVGRHPGAPFVLVDLYLEIEPFPLDLAFDVFWRQGQATLPAAPIALQAESAFHDPVQIFARSAEPGAFELLLRPSRALAVRKLPQATAIWGDEVLLSGELFEKP